MNYATKVKGNLVSLIEEMDSVRWLFTKNPNTDFTRQKKWTFSEMLKFMISMEGKSLKDELYEYFDYDCETPSNSSFNQRRAQILPEAFEFLLHQFTDSYRNNDKSYKGYKLIACDGSDLSITHNPEDKKTYIQSQTTVKGYNQLHLNVFYDLLKRVYIDAIIQPVREENEKRAMCDMIDRYQSNSKSIFIADRGYESYNIFAHAQEKEMHYIIRVKDIDSTGILGGMKVPETDEFDEWISYSLTSRQTKEIKANKEKYKFIPSTSTFDYLNPNNKFYDMKFRVVRFAITDTSYECIITNLSEDEFDASEIKKLYQMR